MRARWRAHSRSDRHRAGRAAPRRETPAPTAPRRCAERCTAGTARGATGTARTAHRPAAPHTARSRQGCSGAGWARAARREAGSSGRGRRQAGGAGRAAAQLALDVIERGVADVLAVHHVDDVLADVLGVIADALERAHHPHDIERAADGARVLHHEGDALPLDRLVLLVHQAVLARDTQRRLDVHAREGIERVMHHLRHHPAEMLDLAVLVRGAFHGGQTRGDVTDLLALIANALEVGDGLDDGDDYPQIPGSRGARGENAAALLVNGDLHVVHLVIVLGNRLAERAVAFHQRGDRLVQLLLDEAAHTEHLAAYPFEVLVEATRDVVAEVSGFHACSPVRFAKPARGTRGDHSGTAAGRVHDRRHSFKRSARLAARRSRAGARLTPRRRAGRSAARAATPAHAARAAATARRARSRGAPGSSPPSRRCWRRARRRYAAGWRGECVRTPRRRSHCRAHGPRRAARTARCSAGWRRWAASGTR